MQVEVLDKEVLGEDDCIGFSEIDVSFALSTTDDAEPFAQRPLRIQLRDASRQHFQVWLVCHLAFPTMRVCRDTLRF